MLKIMNKMEKCDGSFNRFKINLEVTALNISKKLRGNHSEKISFTTEL